jgi:hypothetical protein
MAASSSNAILNVGRLNAFRLNYVQPALKAVRDKAITITLDGVPLKVRYRSVVIKDVINDAPNTCTLLVDDATPPTVGKRLRVVLGVDPTYLLFVGPLQSARETYVGKPDVLEWHCEAIDDTQRSDWLRPFGAWENVSATTVAQQLIASFAPGFSAAGVQAGLAPVTLYLDGTERMGGALKLIAKLIGGYYYVEDYVLHLFVGSESGATPDPVDGRPHQLHADPSLTYASDDSQIRTRVYGKGHGEPTLTATLANESRLPIANAVMFTAGGGKAISEWQRLAYTGTVIGGTGALVGPGVTPAAAPVVSVADGSGVDAGTHNYAYTWVTAAGQTAPSPIASVNLTGGVVPAPTFSVSQGIQLGGPPAGTNLNYVMYITDAAGGGFWSVPSVNLGIASNGHRPVLSFVTTADMRGRIVQFFRNDNNGQGWSPVPIQGGPVGSWTGSPFPPNQPVGYGQSWTDQMVNFTGGGANPGFPNNGALTGGRVVLSGMSPGPSGTIYRYLWRTAANASRLQFLYGYADNTTTTHTDSAADATLTGDAPTVDTSGLQMPAGQVLPGSATMPVSGTGWTVPGGGWAVVGNGDQVVRYSGVSGNQIAGIPATGPGAIVAAVNYQSTVTGAPMLTGVTGNATGIREGAPVNIWVQVDDAAAQAELAARVGGSGVIEHLISDERRGEASLNALATADLALYARPIVTVRYATFDPKSKSGRPVRVTLPALGIDQTLMIQDVTIDNVGPTVPRFTVTASSVRSSLEDVLRQLVGTLEEGF